MSTNTLKEVKEILNGLEPKYPRLKLVSITDEPRVFNNVVAYLRVDTLKLQMINDRDQVFLIIDDGTKYGLELSSILQFLEVASVASIYADYNKRLFKEKWTDQIPIVLETAMENIARIERAITSMTFRADYDQFLRERSKRMFG